MRREIEFEKYKPFQRLDFVYSNNYKTLYIRARLVVMLHENEKVYTPRIVKSKGTYHTHTLFVRGEATGELRPRRLQYYIEFMKINDTDDRNKEYNGKVDGLLKDYIHRKLMMSHSSFFIVNTKITKNPTEEVTNTISEDADIERD